MSGEGGEVVLSIRGAARIRLCMICALAAGVAQCAGEKSIVPGSPPSEEMEGVGAELLRRVVLLHSAEPGWTDPSDPSTATYALSLNCDACKEGGILARPQFKGGAGGRPCSGFVLDEQHIVTAAHCRVHVKAIVGFGAGDDSDHVLKVGESDGAEAQEFRVECTSLYPRANDDGDVDPDIAVCKVVEGKIHFPEVQKRVGIMEPYAIPSSRDAWYFVSHIQGTRATWSTAETTGFSGGDSHVFHLPVSDSESSSGGALLQVRQGRVGAVLGVLDQASDQNVPCACTRDGRDGRDYCNGSCPESRVHNCESRRDDCVVVRSGATKSKFSSAQWPSHNQPKGRMTR